MANIFPLVSEVASATLTLDIADDAEAKTHDFVPASRVVLIDAAGAAVAPTHTVNLTGPNGLVFFIDVTSLDKDTSTAAAAAVIFKKGDNTLTIDAAGEAACVMLTENGFQDASNLLLIGATASATFA